MAPLTQDHFDLVVSDSVSSQGHFVFEDHATFHVRVGHGFLTHYRIAPTVALTHMLSHVVLACKP